ncbi:MAG: ROK family protein [Gemmataceae bacterium]
MSHFEAQAMYLGIEIGGTKLQLGVGAGDGGLRGLWRGAVAVAAGAEGIRQQIVQAFPQLLASAGLKPGDIAGAGIGFGGPVDDATRSVIKSHHVAGWDGFPLVDWIEDTLRLPAVLGNDADVAGLAEARFGAGQGMSPIFYVTIGSGIGGGLIVNGAIYRGCGQGAAEIGHLRVREPGAKGPFRILEHIASGWAIQEEARRLVAEPGPSAVELLSLVDGNPQLLTARHVALAAARGEASSQAILQRAWTALAEALCHVIALLCPRRVVIGGGVSLMGEPLLFAPLRELVAERVFPPFAGCYDIVPAALGEAVVIHGALALAQQQLAR